MELIHVYVEIRKNVLSLQNGNFMDPDLIPNGYTSGSNIIILIWW